MVAEIYGISIRFCKSSTRAREKNVQFNGHDKKMCRNVFLRRFLRNKSLSA